MAAVERQPHRDEQGQPGVEAGKKAASTVIDLQLKILAFLNRKPSVTCGPVEIAEAIGCPEEAETVFRICEHLAANPYRGIQKESTTAAFESKYSKAELVKQKLVHS